MREWPVNIVPSDASLFQHELARRFPPVRLRTVRAAKVVPGLGPCYWCGSIREAQLQWGGSLAKARRALGNARRAIAWWSTSAERSGPDELFWITDPVSSNYFHWITDALAKANLICTSFGQCNILLPKEYEHLGFASQS